jgi:hypothetical protein
VALIREEKGNHQTLQQAAIIACLDEQGTDNRDRINLEDAILKMGREKEIRFLIDCRSPGVQRLYHGNPLQE